MALTTEIAVVGAGPGGAFAAFELARRGVRVTIFDGSHPREKPCGGGITDRALALAAPALATAPPSSTVIHRARFVDARTGRVAALTLDGEGDAARPLVVFDRTSFDGALLAAACRAGATLVQERVSDVEVAHDHVRISTRSGSWRATSVVGADGANSLVRRRVGHPFRRADLSIATGYFAHGVTSEDIVIEMVPDPPGYIWSFPRPTHLAIGICAQADDGVGADALRDRTARWIERTGIARGARLQPYSWPIPTLTPATLATLQVHGPRWCLVGDAAGLVDPITREGIYFALLSGQWAANALTGQDPASYGRRVRERLVPELARAARLKAGFFRPRFTRLLVDALQQSAPVREVMIDLIAGRQPYRGLTWRLLGTQEWGLAWQVLAGRSLG